MYEVGNKKKALLYSCYYSMVFVVLTESIDLTTIQYSNYIPNVILGTAKKHKLSNQCHVMSLFTAAAVSFVFMFFFFCKSTHFALL